MTVKFLLFILFIFGLKGDKVSNSNGLKLFYSSFVFWESIIIQKKKIPTVVRILSLMNKSMATRYWAEKNYFKGKQFFQFPIRHRYFVHCFYKNHRQMLVFLSNVGVPYHSSYTLQSYLAAQVSANLPCSCQSLV